MISLSSEEVLYGTVTGQPPGVCRLQSNSSNALSEQ